MSHYRLKHSFGADILQESQEYREQNIERMFPKEHEKSIISYKKRISTLGSLQIENPVLRNILVE